MGAHRGQSAHGRQHRLKNNVGVGDDAFDQLGRWCGPGAQARLNHILDEITDLELQLQLVVKPTGIGWIRRCHTLHVRERIAVDGGGVSVALSTAVVAGDLK